jgi:iron(III) transport system permease protein
LQSRTSGPSLSTRIRRRLRRRPYFAWAATLLALPLSLPFITIVVLAFFPAQNIWPHLLSTVLPGYVWRTLALMAGVGSLSLVIGTVMAWLVTMHDFPGKRVLQWAALLPMAMPGYIVSYVYVDFLTYAGPFQAWLRKVFGWTVKSDYYFPEVRGLGGAIVILALVLYPYVYLTARAAFLKQSTAQLEVARTLGRTPFQVFRDIALPQARPALVVGVSLVLMECLNDIGAVGFFGVQTLTFGIYSTWLGEGNLGGAAQLSFVLLIFVLLLLLAERQGRLRDAAYHGGYRPVSRQPTPLGGPAAVGASLVLFIPMALGFLVPALILARHAAGRLEMLLDAGLLRAVSHSLGLAVLAGALTIIIGLVLAYANRQDGGRLVRIITQAATVGYAIPGTVLAIGVLIPFASFDNWFNSFSLANFGVSTGLLLSGSIMAVTFAYVTRFLAISFGSLEAGLEKITPNLDAAARTLGRRPFGVVRQIHLPLLRPALLTAALMVFVDAMKELPATLILRPFDFETLATKVFELASLDQLEASAIPALAIVAVGLVPVLLLSRGLRGQSAMREAPEDPETAPVLPG